MQPIQASIRRHGDPFRWILSLCFGLLLCAGLVVVRPAGAQDDSDRSDDFAARDGGDNAGPVRLARFSHVRGDITWRGDPNADWSPATRNLPLRQGAQIWASDGSRTEIQFDDGSRLRLGGGAVVTLQTLYSDADGEFTEITLNDGVAWLRLEHEHSVYQVNTPLISVRAAGPANIAIGAVDGAQVGVHQGRATVEGKQGRATLQSGDYIDLRDDQDPYDIRDLPRPNAWDNWNEAVDRAIDGDIDRPSHRYLPPNLGIVAGDLDEYGTWRSDPTYGEVWCPRVTEGTWRPYYYGRWTWVNPFGWTWVSEEPWGWAPYHYGTWIRGIYGWAWVPGPAVQYWSPAVVHFYDCGGSVAWCPLAPVEVRYPSRLAISYRHGDWSLFFSIGGCAVYYPASNRYCEPRPWNTTYVNHVTYVNNVTNVTNINTTVVNNITVNHNTYLANTFVPVNARTEGATVARLDAFAGRGSYQPVSASDATLFTRGRPIAAPIPGHTPVAGPPVARPTVLAMTPSRTYNPAPPIPAAVLDRPVVRTEVPQAIAQTSAPIRHIVHLNPVTRTNDTTGQTATGRDGTYRSPNRSGGTDSRTNNNGDDTLSPAQRAAIRARESLGLPTRTSGGTGGSDGARTTTGDHTAVREHTTTGEPGGRETPPIYRTRTDTRNDGTSRTTMRGDGTLSPSTTAGGRDRYAPRVDNSSRSDRAMVRRDPKSGRNGSPSGNRDAHSNGKDSGSRKDSKDDSSGSGHDRHP